MRRGKRAALKTPSDACAEDCREKPTWLHCLTIACSRWSVPIITPRESVSTIKPQRRFSAMTCCTSNVNQPTRFRGYDGTQRRVFDFIAAQVSKDNTKGTKFGSFLAPSAPKTPSKLSFFLCGLCELCGR